MRAVLGDIRIRRGGLASRGDWMRLAKLAGTAYAQAAYEYAMSAAGYDPDELDHLIIHPANRK